MIFACFLLWTDHKASFAVVFCFGLPVSFSCNLEQKTHASLWVDLGDLLQSSRFANTWSVATFYFCCDRCTSCGPEDAVKPAPKAEPAVADVTHQHPCLFSSNSKVNSLTEPESTHTHYPRLKGNETICPKWREFPSLPVVTRSFVTIGRYLLNTFFLSFKMLYSHYFFWIMVSSALIDTLYPIRPVGSIIVLPI